MTIINNTNKEPAQNEPSDREIVETIAKFMGYTQIGPSNFYPGRFRGNIKDPKGSYWIPDYLNSLDAMREVESQVEKVGLIGKYLHYLQETCNVKEGYSLFDYVWRRVHAISRQKALAAFYTIKELEAKE